MFSKRKTVHIVEVLLGSLRSGRLFCCKSLSCPHRKRPRQEFSQVPGPPPQAGHPTPSPALSAKAERRRFMSGKAADVHRPAAPQAQPQKQRRVSQPEGSGLNREDFLNMQREVQTFGEPCWPCCPSSLLYMPQTFTKQSTSDEI